MQMNPRYLQRFGDPQPFRDSIARAALRDDPDAAYGDPELEGTEGQRQFEPLDVEPSMNKNSLVAAEGPMSQPPVTAPPSAPMENPIVRAGRERAESAKDPYLDYDPEVPIREARQAFRPSPEMATGMVGVTQAQMREPAAVTAPPPTAPPPESTMAMLIRQRLGNVLPDRKDYPVSKWAKLAAVALGAGQGYYNAANPNARPIDASEAVQNLTFGRKYLDAMGKHQRTNKNLDEQIKLVGEAEDIESRIADRTETQASRKAALARQIRQDDLTDKDRDAAAAASNFKLSLDLANMGWKNVDPKSPVAQGAIRFKNPMDLTGNSFVEGMPTKGTFTVTDPAMATRLNGKPGMEIPWAVLDKLLAFDQAVEVAKIQAGSKQPTKLDPDVILLEEAKKPGTYSPAVIIEARRQRSENHRPPAAAQSFGDGEYSPRQLAALTRLNEQVAKNPNVVRTNSMKNYAATVLSGLSQKTGVGDIAAINQFQKLIDEGAVTRDQDVRLIQGSQDLMNKLKAQISNLTSGQQLSPDLRQQMIAASNAMYETQRKAQANDPYFVSKVKEAKRYGLNIEDTILDGMGDQSAPAQNAGPGRSGGGLPKVTTPAEYAAVRSGQKFQDENGNVRTKK